MRRFWVRGTAFAVAAALAAGNVHFARLAYADAAVSRYQTATSGSLTASGSGYATETEYTDTAADRYDDAADGNGTAADKYYAAATDTEYRVATDTNYHTATETEITLFANGNDQIHNADEFIAALQNGGVYELANDITIGTEHSSSLDVFNNTTILGNGHTVTTGCTIVIKDGARLDLRSTFTLDGSPDAKDCMVYVQGEFNMYDAVLTGRSVSKGECGGVYIDEGGQFCMYEGSRITNCTSTARGTPGAVYNYKGKFHIYGGEISSSKGIMQAVSLIMKLSYI